VCVCVCVCVLFRYLYTLHFMYNFLSQQSLEYLLSGDAFASVREVICASVFAEVSVLSLKPHGN
jgi:hypothetical protein